jgi:hypothetical protein
MREGLFTGPGAMRVKSILYRPTFSGPVDCADLMNCMQVYENYGLIESDR